MICVCCGEVVPPLRAQLGYKTCLPCGETQAKQRRHTIVPLHKSNYMLFVDPEDLKGINNKGGAYR